MYARLVFMVIGVVLPVLAVPLFPAAAQSGDSARARIEAIHGDADGFLDLLAQVQAAIAAGDAAAISQFAFFPLLVNTQGRSQEVQDAPDFVERFETLVSARVRQSVLDQESADLIITSEGVGIGSGALWITNICLDAACNQTQWGIISINN